MAGCDGQKTGRFAQTQEALRCALVSLMEKRGYERIDAVSLCRRAHVSRSTFYKHYRGIDDLLEELEGIHIRSIADLSAPIVRTPGGESDDLSFYERTYAYIMTNREDLHALLVASPDQRFIDRWKDAIKAHIRFRQEERGRAVPDALSLEVAASAVIAGYAYCLSHLEEASSEAVLSLVKSCLAVLDSERR